MSEVVDPSPKVYFNLNLPRLKTILLNLTEYERFNNEFSGQNVTEAITRDVEFYNTQESFRGCPVNFRHLHGSTGFYSKIYGHAESLRSQLEQQGRKVSRSLMQHKSLGVNYSSIKLDEMREIPNEFIFDLLMVLANKQIEITTDPTRMTCYEKKVHDALGD
jgi:hypothetical protein